MGSVESKKQYSVGPVRSKVSTGEKVGTESVYARQCKFEARVGIKIWGG